MPKPNRLLEQDASGEVSYVPVVKYDPIGSTREIPFQISPYPHRTTNMESWFYPENSGSPDDMCRWISADNILLDVLDKFLKLQHGICMIPYLRGGIPGYAFLGQNIIAPHTWDEIRLESLKRAKDEKGSVQSISDNQFAKLVWLKGIMKFKEEYFDKEILTSPSPLEDELEERSYIPRELDLPVLKVTATRRYVRDYSADIDSQVTIDMVKSPNKLGVDQGTSKKDINSKLEDLASRSWAGGMICPHEDCKSWNPDLWPKDGIDVCCACGKNVCQWVNATSLRENKQKLVEAEGISRGTGEAIGGVGIFGGGFTVGFASAVLVLKVIIHARMGG